MTENGADSFTALLALVAELDRHHVSYQLFSSRPDAVMVRAVLPDQHWEVEFLAGGALRVERFDGSGPLAPDDGLVQLRVRIAQWDR